MFFVHFYILTKFHLAVSVEVQLAVECDFRWALRFGDATLQREHAASEHGCIYYLFFYDRRQVVKQDYIVLATNPVLDGRVISLNLWDVLISGCDAKLGM